MINSLAICRLLGHDGNIVFILILSAKANETVQVLGLEVRTDGYLIQPLSMRKLMNRCRA